MSDKIMMELAKMQTNIRNLERDNKSYSKKLNYADKSYQEIMEVNINKKGPRRMIGTPTLWHTKILKKNNFDPFFSGPSDDTDVCYKIFKKGHTFGGSSGVCYHLHRSNIKQYFKKYIWYGKGDALFILKHPERTLSIVKHQLYNYPIKFSFLALKNNDILHIGAYLSGLTLGIITATILGPKLIKE